eukprot:Nk52_evm110s914 gene=Nk52_evmTU110s914
MNLNESQQSHISNGIIISNILEDDSFKIASSKDDLLSLLATFGEVADLFLFPALNRLIVYYYHVEDAVRCKKEFLGVVGVGKINGLKDCDLFFAEKTDNILLLVKEMSSFDEGKKNTLQVPELTKQFLISPPSSPPPGWQQVHEQPPVVNEELLSALRKLTCDGKVHTLYESTPEVPIITLEDFATEEEEKRRKKNKKPGLKMKECRTRLPESVY